MPSADRDWVAQLSSSNEKVQEGAVAALRDFLLRGLRAAYLGKGVDESFCEDIAQESTMRVLNKIDQFAGRSKFTTWAMTIAIRLAVSEFRRKHFQDVSLEQVASHDALRLEVPSDGPAPETDLERAAVLRKLQTLIGQLSEKQRVATQALLGGLPVDQIAERIGSNRNAVYKLIHDARRSLKRGFDEAGYDWQDIDAVLT